MTAKTTASDFQLRWQRRFDVEDNPFTSVGSYCELAAAMLAVGMPLQALEVADEGCHRWPDDLEVAQIRGMALARSQATRAAAEQLTDVVARLRRQPDPSSRLLEEAIGALARTEKDYALLASSPESRRQHLERSVELYEDAYRSTGGYWTGINVATLLTLLGRQDQATAVAKRVEHQCRGLVDALGRESEQYWIMATLGEAALNLRDWSAAEDWYRQAASIVGRRYGDIRSSQRHVELLLEYFQQDSSLAKKWLPLPSVAIFSGHLIDAPDRTPSRFPLVLEARVRDAILRWIRANDVAIGYSSAACGSDILFQEVLQAQEGETHIILPFAEETFVRTSVDNGAAGGWVDRFWNVVASTSGIIRTARDQTDLGPLAYSYANQIIAGTARIHAADLGTELVGLAVWDGMVGRSGGTAEAVKSWRDLGIPMTQVVLSAQPIEINDPLKLRLVPLGSAIHCASANRTSDDAPAKITTTDAGVMDAGLDIEDTRVMSLLFADAVGFSQLSDREIRLFISEYLKRVADLMERYSESIAVRETAGDGLYLAFTTLGSAGCLALDISEMVERTDWQSLGFNTRLRLRVALHAGPVILGHDPITGLPKGVGAHVSRAARLEPKTPPGQVYASEAFAALAQLEPNLPFQCRYVKQLEWAKRYGTFPTYILLRD